MAAARRIDHEADDHDGDWPEYKRLVLESLERLERNDIRIETEVKVTRESMEKKIGDVKESLIVMKTSWGLIVSGLGLMTGIAGNWLMGLFQR